MYYNVLNKFAEKTVIYLERKKEIKNLKEGVHF